MNLLLAASIMFGGGHIDFDLAHKLGLPPFYMFDRQEQTFNGHLNPACSGSECPKSNYLLNQ